MQKAITEVVIPGYNRPVYTVYTVLQYHTEVMITLEYNKSVNRFPKFPMKGP